MGARRQSHDLNLPEFPEPGGRLAGETAKAFDAFTHYRDMEPSLRSIRAAFDARPARTRGALSQWEAWSAETGWIARAQEWDDFKDRQKRVAEARAAQEMGARHAKAAEALIEKGLAALRKIRVDELTGGEIVRFVVEGAKLERLARGEPEVIGTFVAGSALDPQEALRRASEEDPAVAKALAAASAQLIRAERERQEAAERDGR